MRDSILWEAHSRQAFGRLTKLVRVVRNLWQRNDLKRLATMDDHMLADIGLTRDVVLHLMRQPLTSDLDWERERFELQSLRK